MCISFENVMRLVARPPASPKVRELRQNGVEQCNDFKCAARYVRRSSRTGMVDAATMLQSERCLQPWLLR
jgi:hypothetical protein